MQWIYLDNNATTRPAPEVTATVTEAMQQYWANPSSAHRLGQQVRQRVELARQSVARLLGVEPRELIFTSGGTESNNLALRGLLEGTLSRENPGVLVTTPVEHSAVREPAEAWAQLGGMVEELPIDADGLVRIEGLSDLLVRHLREPRTVVLSVQWANNETGVIQPVEAIAQAVHDARVAVKQAESGADTGGVSASVSASAGRSGSRSAAAKLYLHTDATQAVGKLAVDAKRSGVDLLTLAGHKFHGPKGVGALYVRSGVRLRAIQRGGAQEREKRGGTENTFGIIGLGVAADLARQFVMDEARIAELRTLRDRFESLVCERVGNVRINGTGGPEAGSDVPKRLWNTSNLAFPGLEAEAILLGLSERGVCASAGAACSSGSLEPSPVLLAMGLDDPTAHGSVRFSLSRHTTADEIERAAEVVAEVVAKLGRTLPLGV